MNTSFNYHSVTFLLLHIAYNELQLIREREILS